MNERIDTANVFAGGMLNLVSWPMMFMSGVWFSLEGSPAWVEAAAQAFPLTHLIDAARAIMNEGAGLVDVGPNLLAMVGMTVLLGGLGSWMFRWE